MRIGLISYEFPPDTADGGIATYALQAAQMLSKRGHDIEVFAASRTNASTERISNVLVHRLFASERHTFPVIVAPKFAEQHDSNPFDVIEAPDYGADAKIIVQQLPDLPFMLRLHTPRFLIERLARQNQPLRQQLREFARALYHGQRPACWYNRESDEDCHYARRADEVAAPSLAIGRVVTETWALDPARVSRVPLPYAPSSELLGIPTNTTGNVVTYIGRLEASKGILDLADAILIVMKAHPNTRWRLIGRAKPEMQLRLEEKLGAVLTSVEFVGQVPLDQMPSELSKTDLCVIPSHWENFSVACLESMAAGRGIVATAVGGTPELLGDGLAGVLVPSKRPKALAKALVALLEDAQGRAALGQAARQRVLECYSPESVSILQEQSYERAIARHRTR